VVVAFDIDAVTTNEPVLIGVTFNANDAVVANDADVANDELIAILEFTACEALTAFVASEAVIVKLLMFEPVPSVRILPEICTRSSYVEAIVCPVKLFPILFLY
jgi:hypothetical protein